MNKEKSYKISLFVLIAIILIQIYYIVSLKSQNIELQEIVIVEKKYKNLKINSSEQVVDFEIESLKPIWKISHKVDFSSLRNKYSVASLEIDISKMSVEKKKQYFIDSILNSIKESYEKLIITYKNVTKLRKKELTIEDEEYLSILYERYRVKNNNFDALLKAIKPHPISLILAQAIISSGWGESRFFIEGNNIFSLISIDENEDRMKVKDGDIYMKKYDSLVESADDYMLLLGRGERYSDFREARNYTKDPYKLSKYLSSFSEDSKYSKKIRETIKYNRLYKFDKEEIKSKIIIN